LPAARVVFADHDLLQHDFPFLLNRRLLDEWLLTNTAFISESQPRQNLVNTPIETTDERVVALATKSAVRWLPFSMPQPRTGNK
jgi:hypothetical protein